MYSCPRLLRSGKMIAFMEHRSNRKEDETVSGINLSTKQKEGV